MEEFLEPIEPGTEEEQHWFFVLDHHKLDPLPYPYEVVQVAQVNNPYLRSQYAAKQKEFQRNKYPHDAARSYYGFAVEADDDLHDVLRDGPMNRKATYHILGHNDMGFHIWRHSDVCMKNCKMIKAQGFCFLVVYKFMYGKSKSVIVEKLRSNGNMLLPTPGYDSHVSTVAVSTEDLSIKDNINHSQVYLYSLSPVKYKPCHPTHVYPVAIITLISKTDVKMLDQFKDIGDAANQSDKETTNDDEQYHGVLVTSDSTQFKKKEDFQVKKSLTHFLSTVIEKPLPSSFLGLLESVQSKPLHLRFTDMNNNADNMKSKMVKVKDSIQRLEPKIKFSSAGRGFTDKSSNFKWVSLKSVTVIHTCDNSSKTPPKTPEGKLRVEVKKTEESRQTSDAGKDSSEAKLTVVTSDYVNSSAVSQTSCDVETKNQKNQLSEDIDFHQQGNFDPSGYLLDKTSQQTSVELEATNFFGKLSGLDNIPVQISQFRNDQPTVALRYHSPVAHDANQKQPAIDEGHIPVYISGSRGNSPVMSVPEGSFSAFVISSETDSSEPVHENLVTSVNNEACLVMIGEKLSTNNTSESIQPDNVDASVNPESQEAPADVLNALNHVQSYIDRLTSEAKLQDTKSTEEKSEVRLDSDKLLCKGNEILSSETNPSVPTIDNGKREESINQNPKEAILVNPKIGNIPEKKSFSSDSDISSRPIAAKLFHGRTLLKGKEVPPRTIPLVPSYVKRPVKPSGRREVIPEDPRKPNTCDSHAASSDLPLPNFAKGHKKLTFTTSKELESKIPNFIKQYMEISASILNDTECAESLKKDMSEVRQTLRKQFQQQILGCESVAKVPSTGHDCDYSTVDMECDTRSSSGSLCPVAEGHCSLGKLSTGNPGFDQDSSGSVSCNPITLQEEYDLLDEMYDCKHKGQFKQEMEKKCGGVSNDSLECKTEVIKKCDSSKKDTRSVRLLKTEAKSEGFALSGNTGFTDSSHDKGAKVSNQSQKGTISPIVYDLSRLDSPGCASRQANTIDLSKSAQKSKSVFQRLGISPESEKRSKKYSDRKKNNSWSSPGTSHSTSRAKKRLGKDCSSKKKLHGKRHVDYSADDTFDPRERTQVDYSDINFYERISPSPVEWDDLKCV